MEPSRQQAVRSEKMGGDATLRAALRSTHIMERETAAAPAPVFTMAWPRRSHIVVMIEHDTRTLPYGLTHRSDNGLACGADELAGEHQERRSVRHAAQGDHRTS
jgi:hypothetical protein